jgi:hypothetical protein
MVLVAENFSNFQKAERNYREKQAEKSGKVVLSYELLRGYEEALWFLFH